MWTQRGAGTHRVYTGIHMHMYIYMDSRNTTVLVHSNSRVTTGGNSIISTFREKGRICNRSCDHGQKTLAGEKGTGDTHSDPSGNVWKSFCKLSEQYNAHSSSMIYQVPAFPDSSVFSYPGCSMLLLVLALASQNSWVGTEHAHVIGTDWSAYWNPELVERNFGCFIMHAYDLW